MRVVRPRRMHADRIPSVSNSRKGTSIVKPLLVMDVNGVFAAKVDSGYPNPDLKLRHRSLVFRPGYREFFTHVFDRYSVGFYTSTRYYNAKPVIDKLFTPAQAREV